MEIWILCFVVVGAVVGALWRRLRPRRVFTIIHVRVEMHEAVVVEDRVIEAVWRAAISMKNVSRRPRMLPVFAERATVRAGWREYLATVYLEDDAGEVNPAEVALAWVECVLPVGACPGVLDGVLLCQRRRTRNLGLLFGSELVTHSRARKAVAKTG